MQKTKMMSPIARRLKEKGPNKYCLVKTRVITDEDMELFPKWEVIKSWYEAIESDPNHESLHMILQSMINAVLYQERIYFAVTRANVVELFKNDKNWKGNKPGLRNSSYKDLLSEMVESGIFEAHPENDRFYAQKKPRIFKLIDESILSLMKPVSEDIQLKQVFDFVENNSGDEVGDHHGDEVGDLVLVEEEVEVKGEVEHSLSSLPSEPKGKVEFMDLLALQHPKSLPRFEDIEPLVELAILNCVDFDADRYTFGQFEKHMKNCVGDKTPKLKKHIANLVDKLKIESEKQLRVKKNRTVSLVQPTNSTTTTTKRTTVNMDEEAENYTLKMLNNSFGKENIKVLKRKLERVEDEKEKFELIKEIEFWESVV